MFVQPWPQFPTPKNPFHGVPLSLSGLLASTFKPWSATCTDPKTKQVTPSQPSPTAGSFQTVSLVMVSYTYRIQNKPNHTHSTQSDWTGSKTKTTCVSLASRTPSGLFDHHNATCARSVLYQGKISSPHRRAEATGHLQSKVTVNAAAAGTRSGWCFQSQNHFFQHLVCSSVQKQRNCSLSGNAFPGCLRGPQRRTQIDASRQEQGMVHPAPLAGLRKVEHTGTTGGGGGSLATRVAT